VRGAWMVIDRLADPDAILARNSSYDRYGHLMPGNENAAALLNAYLERSNTQARLATLDD
jgi:type IV secretory pathway TrbF-like protein